jgi:hypothetical protein
MQSRLVLALLLASRAVSGQDVPLVISEIRWSGPGGSGDEYVELYNTSDEQHVVAGAGGGYAVVASDGTARCVLPTGTLIPGRGHFLCVNADGYSLAGYPAGTGSTAVGDASYTADIPDNVGVALFDTAEPADFVFAHRLDAVGAWSETDELYREGLGLSPITAPVTNHAWQRDECGKDGVITTPGPCPQPRPNDTDDNAADFVFVDVSGTEAGGGQRLGAPGPQTLVGPVTRGPLNVPSVIPALFDECVAPGDSPNNVRSTDPGPGGTAPWGTLTLHRRFTNRTGAPITRLRFRVVDLTTYPAPVGTADVRLRSSQGAFFHADRVPCGTGYSLLRLEPTILEEPPGQPHGGGFNASLSVPAVTPATPLADGASINARFFLGIMQTGILRIAILVEAYPDGGALWVAEGTDERIETDSGGPTTAVEPEAANRLVLSDPMPNPARDRAALYLIAPNDGHVAVTLHDATGRRVAVLMEGRTSPAWPVAINMDTTALSAGVYLVRAEGEGLIATRTLTLTR